MFGPDYDAGCASCSSLADGFNGSIAHLTNHDVMFALVSRAPIEKLEAYKKRMGWNITWLSAAHTDFNSDFNVWFTPEEQTSGGITYNYRDEPAAEWKLRDSTSPVDQLAAMSGTDSGTYTRERPGLSAFVLDGGQVFHTYSAYARGLDAVWGMYQLLDRAPRGRNEQGVWWRRHDEYPSP
jgi:predicted dithiol-disulfide oxidoreductase (DUF899 family)